MATSPSVPSQIVIGSTILLGVASTLWLYIEKQKKAKSYEIKRSKKCIYLDYNGTTPIYPQVAAAMIPYISKHFGNPGSTHCYGDAPRQAVEHARQQILSDLLGVPNEPPTACIFTACGTEADNMAIHLALSISKVTKPHIVTTNVEHPAVENCLQYYEKVGKCSVTYVPVLPNGCVTSQALVGAIQSNTILVALMLANNESGALQPVREVAEHCRRKRILCFTDAAQAAGKVSLHLKDLGYPDMVTIVGHKLGAPKGIACLYVRPGCVEDPKSLPPLLHGGGQEFGLRGGTENVPYIVGLGMAAQLAAKNLQRNQMHMETLRSRLLSQMTKALGDTLVVHGPTNRTDRLPNTLSVGFRGVQSARLLLSVRNQVAVSAGATCHATGPISSVLRAMKIPDDLARGTIRLSLGPHTTVEEVDRASQILIEQVERQRNEVSQ